MPISPTISAPAPAVSTLPGRSARIRGGIPPVARASALDNTAWTGSYSLTMVPECRRLPAADSNVSLILALPRPRILSRMLSTFAELGVHAVAVCNAARVEKEYFGSHVTRAEYSNPPLPGTLTTLSQVL